GEIGLSQLLVKAGFTTKAIYNNTELFSRENIKNFMEAISLPRPSVSHDFLGEYQDDQSFSGNLPDYKLIPGGEKLLAIINEIFDVNCLEMNPTHRIWPLLLVKGCPLLKRDLFEKNPENLVSFSFLFYLLNYIENVPVFFAETLANLNKKKTI
ncbi:MAG: hypothetical protein QNJ46_03235, partial [Leptolyngbyaceae cyanobacterium MO_188.B28]|nr:hypothetical protein [Leptolyngbyaceae cyanobacterium MO_188.B28]